MTGNQKRAQQEVRKLYEKYDKLIEATDDLEMRRELQQKVFEEHKAILLKWKD